MQLKVFYMCKVMQLMHNQPNSKKPYYYFEKPKERSNMFHAFRREYQPQGSYTLIEYTGKKD